MKPPTIGLEDTLVNVVQDNTNSERLTQKQARETAQ